MFKFKDKDIYSTEDIKQMIDDNFYFWKNLLDDYQSERKELKERISELETEAGKEDYINEELTKLRKENDNLNKNLKFKISDYNWKLIKDWQTQHLSEVHKNNTYIGAIGGIFEYQFIPTGIGTSVRCLCNICQGKALVNSKTYTEFISFLNEYNAFCDVMEE